MNFFDFWLYLILTMLYRESDMLYTTKVDVFLIL
jgi:hypothetical protein